MTPLQLVAALMLTSFALGYLLRDVIGCGCRHKS